jgi:hypothetical protein
MRHSLHRTKAAELEAEYSQLVPKLKMSKYMRLNFVQRENIFAVFVYCNFNRYVGGEEVCV